MEANCWIDGKYYVGSDGAMLVNATTPDGYKVDENGVVILNSKNSQYSKSQIVGRYQYDEDGELGGYYDGKAHYSHTYILKLNEDNTFDYTYDNAFRVYDESGTYSYDENKGELTFSENPYITKGIIKDGGILISELTDGDIFFVSK